MNSLFCVKEEICFIEAANCRWLVPIKCQGVVSSDRIACNPLELLIVCYDPIITTEYGKPYYGMTVITPRGDVYNVNKSYAEHITDYLIKVNRNL